MIWYKEQSVEINHLIRLGDVVVDMRPIVDLDSSKLLAALSDRRSMG